MNILVTGAAGFIGFFLTKALLERGDQVIGVDNINDYYDVNLKYSRLGELGISKTDVSWNKPSTSNVDQNFKFYRMNLEDKDSLMSLCDEYQFDIIVNLAAQAGVRYSIENPDVYIQSNIVGFFNVLEAARRIKVKHLVYASSSSVYGMNEKIPFSVQDSVDHPVSLYAATKKSNELMAHSYSHLYGIPTSGLRFFTVYGPWGRPDMAYYLFADAISTGRPIKVFNHGNMKRDFTYIDDIIAGIVSIISKPPTPATEISDLNNSKRLLSDAPYRICNLGNNRPVKLMDFINVIEENLRIKAKIDFLEMQSGDVPATWADIEDSIENFGYQPSTSIEEGMERFIRWYRSFRKVV